MKKVNVKNLITVMIALGATTLSIWLPGIMMQKNLKSQLSEIQNVPAEYYSGPSEAIIKNSSKQLTSEQCIQLITGTWESTVAPASPDYCNITEFGIKNMLVNRVEDLKSKQLYPVSLSSGPDNWYSWEATPYRALETTFQTYAAIFWDIRFTRYDNTEYHRFIITESGDILYAEFKLNEETKNESEAYKKLRNFQPELSNSSYLLFYYGEYTTTTYNSGNLRVAAHGNGTTAYTTSPITASGAAKLDTSPASFFTPDFVAFKPDEACFLDQTTSGSNDNKMQYSVSYSKDDTIYRILMLSRN